jgi:hypothetical protein
MASGDAGPSVLPPGFGITLHPRPLTPSTNTDIELNHMNTTGSRVFYEEDYSRPSTCDTRVKATHQQDGNPPTVEESLEARLERLGRQRPEVFASIYAEIGFVFSISMSQVLSVSC